MPKTDVSVRPEIQRFRSLSLKMVSSGIGLLLLGVAITWEVRRQEPATSSQFFAQVQNVVRNVLIMVGTILAWVGGVRMSLVMRPLNAILLGLACVVTTLLGPLVAVQVFPALKNLTWSGAYLAPIFALRIIGFVLISTGLLRSLSRNRYELYK